MNIRILDIAFKNDQQICINVRILCIKMCMSEKTKNNLNSGIILFKIHLSIHFSMTLNLISLNMNE